MVGIRRAIALLFLGFYVTQFAMTAGLGPDETFAFSMGLALCYGLAFVGLAAEWFWARWFAIGVGNFGSFALLVLLQTGAEPIITFFGVTHVIIWVMLLGEGMAAKYEHSEHTAERWNFQEESLILMRRAVKSAGTTLPFLILYTLAPRPEALQLTALAVGVAGLWGLLRGRTWGALALGTAGLIGLVDGLGWVGSPVMSVLPLDPSGSIILHGPFAGLGSGFLLLVPLVLAGSMVRFVRAR